MKAATLSNWNRLSRWGVYALLTGAVSLFAFSCNKSDSSSDDGGGDTSATDTSDDSEDEDNPRKNTDPEATSADCSGGEASEAGTLALSTNCYAEAYPEGLAISSFPESVTTAETTAAGTINISSALTSFGLQDDPPMGPPPNGDGPMGPPPNGDMQNPPNGDQHGGGGNITGDFSSEQNIGDRLLEKQNRLNGTADNCFDEDVVHALMFENRMADACYEFDFGILSGQALGTVDPAQINQGGNTFDDVVAHVQDLEKTEAADGTTPCMVVKGRELVDTAAARVEGAMSVVEGMLCEAKKRACKNSEGKTCSSGLDGKLPGVGESLDLKSVFADRQHFSVESASISRLEDNDSRPVYHTEVSLTLSGLNNTNSVSLNLIHSPSANGNEAYNGAMWIQSEGRLGGSSKDSYDVLSIAYSKEGTTAEDIRQKFEIRKASYAQDLTDPILFSDGTLNMNPDADANGNFPTSQHNDHMTGIEYWNFDINPITFEGDIAYWKNPGGFFQEKARGFVFSSSQQTDGTIKGCAYAGASNISIRKAVRDSETLNPEGCYTPFINDGVCGSPGDNQGPQTWKQCYKQESDGKYKIDTAATTSSDGFDIIQGKPDGVPEFRHDDKPRGISGAHQNGAPPPPQ